MEWQGVNLSSHHAHQWAKQYLSRLIHGLIILFLSILFALYMAHAASELAYTEEQLIQDIQKWKHTAQTSGQKLINLRQAIEPALDTPPIPHNIVDLLLEHLPQLPLDGGLETVLWQSDPTPAVILTGQFKSQSQRQQLENYFQQAQLRYEIGQLTMQTPTTIEFHFTLLGKK